MNKWKTVVNVGLVIWILCKNKSFAYKMVPVMFFYDIIVTLIIVPVEKRIVSSK